MTTVSLDVENLRAVFAKMDADHSGTLSQKEMVAGLSKLGIDAEESANLVKHIDGNNDGNISYDEVVEFLPEINTLLREEIEEKKRADELKKKRETLLAKRVAQAKLMEERVLRKVNAITTEDPKDLKRALAKALLVIDELRADEGDAASKAEELQMLRAYKTEVLSFHVANFPKNDSSNGLSSAAAVTTAICKLRLKASIPSSRQPKKALQGCWGKKK
jgi:hypothetical protein|eukprot:g5066.t1